MLGFSLLNTRAPIRGFTLTCAGNSFARSQLVAFFFLSAFPIWFYSSKFSLQEAARHSLSWLRFLLFVPPKVLQRSIPFPGILSLAQALLPNTAKRWPRHRQPQYRSRLLPLYSSAHSPGHGCILAGVAIGPKRCFLAVPAWPKR